MNTSVDKPKLIKKEIQMPLKQSLLQLMARMLMVFPLLWDHHVNMYGLMLWVIVMT